MKRLASAEWVNGLKDGKGSLSTESGTLDKIPYSFKARFESGTGTNPEELIAAAHAGCFSMAFSAMLEQEGFTAEHIETTAQVTIKSAQNGFSIPLIELTMKARIADIEEFVFLDLANKAKENCPVSNLMNAKITLESKLIN